jgi:hypothetical protein
MPLSNNYFYKPTALRGLHVGQDCPLLYGVELFPNNPRYVGNTLSSVHNPYLA